MSSSLLPSSRSAGREVWLGTARAACQGRFSWRAAGGTVGQQSPAGGLGLLFQKGQSEGGCFGHSQWSTAAQHGRESLEEPEALSCVNTLTDTWCFPSCSSHTHRSLCAHWSEQFPEHGWSVALVQSVWKCVNTHTWVLPASALFQLSPDSVP